MATPPSQPAPARYPSVSDDDVGLGYWLAQRAGFFVFGAALGIGIAVVVPHRHHARAGAAQAQVTPQPKPAPVSTQVAYVAPPSLAVTAAPPPIVRVSDLASQTVAPQSGAPSIPSFDVSALPHAPRTHGTAGPRRAPTRRTTHAAPKVADANEGDAKEPSAASLEQASVDAHALGDALKGLKASAEPAPVAPEPDEDDNVPSGATFSASVQSTFGK